VLDCLVLVKFCTDWVLRSPRLDRIYCARVVGTSEVSHHAVFRPHIAQIGLALFRL